MALSVLRRTPAAIGGAVATLVATAALLAAPEALAFEALRDGLEAATGVYLLDDPLPVLGYLGGLAGGFAAGYLTRGGWYDLLANALQALFGGLLAYYVLSVAATLLAIGSLRATFVIVVVFQQLLFFLVPFSVLYLLEGVPAALSGWWLAPALAARIELERSGAAARVVRAAVATLVFLSSFLVVWTLVFVLEDAYCPLGCV